MKTSSKNAQLLKVLFRQIEATNRPKSTIATHSGFSSPTALKSSSSKVGSGTSITSTNSSPSTETSWSTTSNGSSSGFSGDFAASTGGNSRRTQAISSSTSIGLEQWRRPQWDSSFSASSTEGGSQVAHPILLVMVSVIRYGFLLSVGFSLLMD